VDTLMPWKDFTLQKIEIDKNLLNLKKRFGYNNK
jgi:hypothetical protein